VASAAYGLATALHVRYEHVGQGEATAAVTAGAVRALGAGSGEAVRRMADALGAGGAGAPETAAPAAADALGAFYQGLGMPSRVRDLGIPQDALPLVAGDTLKNFNANRGTRPADQAERMLALLRSCW
jgi:alcohol dehydrogenase